MTLLVFVHVPKAAGTTLQQLIDDLYPPRSVLSFDDPQQAEEVLAATPQAALDGIEAVKGHVHFGVHRHFRQPARYVTMLRDPVARIVSHYHYVRSNPAHYLHAAVVERDLDLLGYARGDLSRELRDGQVRMFSARARELEACDETCLAEAKRVLAEEFEVVGLAERFDESVLLMQAALGWPRPYYVVENRGTAARPAPSEEEVAAIEAASPHDVALYDFAAELLERRIEAEQGLGKRVERFRRRNRVLGPAATRLRRARARVRGSR